MTLAESDGTKHADGGASLAHVAHRDHPNPRNAYQQSKGEVALKQRQDSQNQGVDDHDFLSHRLNVDITIGQFNIENILKFVGGLAYFS